MRKRLEFDIVSQPNDITCGPTCLYSVYRYHEYYPNFDKLLSEVTMLQNGGCLTPQLGIHALSQGFSAKIFAFNLNIFDPSWFELPADALIEKLGLHAEIKTDPKLRFASKAYQQFLQCGGEIKFEDLSSDLIRKPLLDDIPIICALSSTWLYHAMREIPENCVDHDLQGEPTGHFVVLSGFDMTNNLIKVSDPYEKNPLSKGNTYSVTLDRLICAILLGVVTCDANLLLIEPKK
ncbi:MAG: hypothetical protein V4629_02830 [Pseudomonadota bacterium]